MEEKVTSVEGMPVLLSEEQPHDYHCLICGHHYTWRPKTLTEHEPTDWMQCGHHWKRLVDDSVVVTKN
jgi:hypothetical protein